MPPPRRAAWYCWEELAEEQLNDLLSRRLITGDRLMLAHVYLKKGCIVPRHAHENEQFTYILDGALRFLVGENGEQEVVVRGGGGRQPGGRAIAGAAAHPIVEIASRRVHAGSPRYRVSRVSGEFRVSYGARKRSDCMEVMTGRSPCLPDRPQELPVPRRRYRLPRRV